MEHEQVNERAVALSIRGAKLTGRLLAKAMRAFLQHKKRARDAPTVGGQSMKTLNRKMGGVQESVEIGDRVKSFERIARKNQVSYHIRKVRGGNPPKYTVYFNSRHKGGIEAAFKEYMALMLKKQERGPSLFQRLAQYKDLVKETAAPEKNRRRGDLER